MQAKTRVGGLFRNTGFILALAFIIGLGLPQGAPKISSSVTPLLAVTMTLSVMAVSPKLFLDFKRISRPILISLLLNYVVLGFIFIGLANLLIPEYDLWVGFVLVAAVPPAIAVIPFTHHLKGDTEFSLIGTVASYIAALFLIPLFSATFLGVNVIQPQDLLISLAQLIIIPMAIAQLLRRFGIDQKLDKYRGTIVNWCFFVVVYIIVGLNQSAFFEEPLILLRVAVIAFVTVFVLSDVVNRIAKRLGRDKPNRISLMLISTRKNYGLAAAIGIALFSDKAALPAALAMVFNIGHFIWLTTRVKKMD